MSRESLLRPLLLCITLLTFVAVPQTGRAEMVIIGGTYEGSPFIDVAIAGFPVAGEGFGPYSRSMRVTGSWSVIDSPTAAGQQIDYLHGSMTNAFQFSFSDGVQTLTNADIDFGASQFVLGTSSDGQVTFADVRLIRAHETVAADDGIVILTKPGPIPEIHDDPYVTRCVFVGCGRYTAFAMSSVSSWTIDMFEGPPAPPPPLPTSTMPLPASGLTLLASLGLLAFYDKRRSSRRIRASGL